MQALRRQSEEPAPEITRAQIILARKPAPRGPAARTLLEVVVPRSEPRQTHERHEDRRVLSGVTARLGAGKTGTTVPVANLSSNGIMIVSDRFFAIGREVPVAIEHCDPIPMIVRWVRDGRVGLEFLAETTIVARAGVQDYILETIRREGAATSFGTPTKAGPEARTGAPRHTLMWLCEITLGETVFTARIRNVSREGAMVSFDEELLPNTGERITLALGDDARFEGHLRWVVPGLAGLSFAEPFPVEDLIDHPCAQIVADNPEPAAPRSYASREDAMRIEYSGMARPYEAPEMDYKPLTLRELYTTLYSGSNN